MGAVAFKADLQERLLLLFGDFWQYAAEYEYDLYACSTHMYIFVSEAKKCYCCKEFDTAFGHPGRGGRCFVVVQDVKITSSHDAPFALQCPTNRSVGKGNGH